MNNANLELESTPSSQAEVNLIDLMIVIAKRKKTLVVVTSAFAICAAIISVLLPNIYTSETRIMPPQQTQSIASSMLGQLGPLAGFAGKDLGIKAPGEIYIAMLQSRAVADNLILRFRLMDLYGKKTMKDAREKLEENTKILSNSSGVISISVEDHDSKRAADLANAYVEQLYKLNQGLAITEASQRRLFFERELQSAKKDLIDAELEMKRTQESTGIIALDSQAKAIIESVASLRAQIAAKEVQLRSMRSYATNENPDVIRVGRELQELQSQLANSEHGQNLGNGDILVATGKVPTAGLEYVRRLRDVKYQETIFEILAKQYEIAKIDEGKNASLIQVIDKAVEAEKRSSPRRLLIILVAGITGFFFSFVCIALQEAYERLERDPEQAVKLRTLSTYFSGKF